LRYNLSVKISRQKVKRKMTERETRNEGDAKQNFQSDICRISCRNFNLCFGL